MLSSDVVAVNVPSPSDVNVYVLAFGYSVVWFSTVIVTAFGLIFVAKLPLTGK